MLHKEYLKITTRVVLIVIFIFCYIIPVSAEVAETAKRYIRIGKLQSHFSAYGSERAWNESYYEGMIWPADYLEQDNAVIKRSWIAAKDFTDKNNQFWDFYAVYFAKDYAKQSLFPIELKQTAKFSTPIVLVDGQNITAPYAGDVDEVVPDQIPDRIVTNVVNTSMGLTMTLRILAFSQQYHDDYFIKEYTFTNTGNIDYDDEQELTAPLSGVRIGWGIRYSVCRDGANKINSTQSWGQHTWVTKRGEDFPQHVDEMITEDNPIVQWIRCGFSWAGQAASNSFDNIGGPDIKGNGRLAAPQHAGIACLHIDKSATDKENDPYQPAVLGWHAGDTYPSVGNLLPADMDNMGKVYDMLSGNPYTGLGGTDRFDETYMASNPDPVTVHNDGGGTNVWICYGPFDLEPGESVRIVEAEAVNGLSRVMCEEIGKRWKKAYQDASDKGPFVIPDGSQTDNKDVYKNSWVYTGKDSILLTFGRALRNFDLNYEIPQPPLPPPVFEVTSGGDRISLTWNASPSESDPDFDGYKIYRAVGKPDTTYEMLADVEKGTIAYDEKSAIRGKSYYYYIVSYNDGSNNPAVPEAPNPPGSLHSSKFYTRTTTGAYLRRQAAKDFKNIRIVPNPYSIKARDIQYTGEKDKIMFLDIPAYCTIRIFTERGDLVQTIDHDDGSGDHAWNSITSSRQVVVSGIYIAHFEVTQDFHDPVTNELLYKKGDSTFRKFIIIR